MSTRFARGVHVSVRGTSTIGLHDLDAPVRDETPLETFLARLSQTHPELAPLLEDATHQADLEIRLNDAPVARDAADHARVRAGDTVALRLKNA